MLARRLDPIVSSRPKETLFFFFLSFFDFLLPASLFLLVGDNDARPPAAGGWRIFAGPATKSCGKCETSENSPGKRPCSRSQERQESFALDLAASLGVRRGGTFLEMGGHDGLTASNTVHTE